jgi:hypothetical protein
MALEVTYKNRTYTFGFSKQTAANLEEAGFALEKLTDKPNLMVPMLVYHAAVANNPGIKRKLVDEIYEEIDDKSGFIAALVEEYGKPTEALFASKEQGNATWKQV